ncbi:hypothetical protein D3C76_1570630 [compost metagenome]
MDDMRSVHHGVAALRIDDLFLVVRLIDIIDISASSQDQSRRAVAGGAGGGRAYRFCPACVLFQRSCEHWRSIIYRSVGHRGYVSWHIKNPHVASTHRGRCSLGCAQENICAYRSHAGVDGDLRITSPLTHS